MAWRVAGECGARLKSEICSKLDKIGLEIALMRLLAWVSSPDLGKTLLREFPRPPSSGVPEH